MAKEDIYVKEIVSSTGKKKYQAEVWYQGAFYGSKVFATESLAVAYKNVELLKAIKGGKTAAQRAAQRRLDEGLDQPMSYWASLYVAKFADTHCATRLADYHLVGRLLANTPLRAFDGKAGAELIQRLSESWYTDRQPRTTKPRPSDAKPVAPLSHSAVRHRLSALLRLLPFAKARLPAGATFAGPAWDELFPPFELPPAHATPRRRQPSEAECRTLLSHFGVDSDMGEFIQIVDETGARLGEIRGATGSAIEISSADGRTVGGCLTLAKHKTVARTGIREVPLSMYAAQLLERRKRMFGQGALFPGLHSKDSVCKQFDKACGLLNIGDLLIKDFRRAFINRNKSSVSDMDLFHMVGDSSLLSAGATTDSEKATVAAVGHKLSKTTAGYAVPDIEKNARIFTNTSRNPLITREANDDGQSELRQAADKLSSLQAQVAEAVKHLAVLNAGKTIETPAPATST